VRTAVITLAAVAALAGCGTRTSTVPDAAPVPDADEVAVELAWDQQTAEEQAEMCAYVAINGSAAAAAIVVDGAGGKLDPVMVARKLEEFCD
jgi:hypothetical protein